MIKNIAISKYFPENSAIHRLDARIKLISSVLFFTFAFSTKNYISLIILLTFIIIAMIISSIPLLEYFKGSKSIITITLFTSLINLFFEVETKFLSSKEVLLTPQILQNSILVFIRLIILVLTSSILMFTTSPQNIADAIESILCPLKYFKVNVQELSITITLSLRLIPMLIDETEKIMLVQKSKGIDFKNKNIIKKIKAFSNILTPLFMSSFKKANDLAIAMESRCYNSSAERTKFRSSKLKFSDIMAIIFISIVFSGVILCNQIVIF